MPIRFRCAYCNQLMGIARRKAGTVVRCPSCSGQLVVPEPEGEETQEPAGAEDSPLFERNEFDEMLDSATSDNGSEAPASPPTPVSVPAAAPSGPRPPAPVPWGAGPLPSPAGKRGIILSPTMATVLTVAAIVAVVLAFALGFLLGYLLRPAQREERIEEWPTCPIRTVCIYRVEGCHEHSAG